MFLLRFLCALHSLHSAGDVWGFFYALYAIATLSPGDVGCFFCALLAILSVNLFAVSLSSIVLLLKTLQKH